MSDHDREQEDLTSKDMLEDIIDALGFKDLEIIETYTALNRAIILGQRSPASLRKQIGTGRILRRIDFDFDQIKRLVSPEKARKIRRLVRRYDEFREDCLTLLASVEKGARLPKMAYRRVSDEVLDLITFIETLKEDAWDRYAATDELTGLLNRTAMTEIIARETRRATHAQTQICVALVDADHFKAINDTHGHDAGDQVLIEMAERISDNLRAYDHVFRYGGEEILVLMPRTGQKAGKKVLERVRKSIADTPFSLSGPDDESTAPLPVTISIGFSEWHPGTDMDTIFKAADDALYNAKESGRNRICKAH